MKSIFYNFVGAITILCLVVVTSCKKSDNDDLDFGGKSEITMEVDGKPWKAKFAITMTMPPEEDGEDYYIVAITGTDVEVDASDEITGNTGGLFLWFAVPKSKFKAPKGVCNFTDTGADNVSPEFPAFAMFNTIDGEKENRAYSTIQGEGGTSGSLKIEDFKIGKQEFLGHIISDADGYTSLSGTFSMNMSSYSESGAEVIKITNGKFNVSSGFNLGSLFGQFPDVEERFKELN